MARALFRDRQDAGRQLAKALRGYAGNGALVLALPRGGVPVAHEVARALHGDLDVLVARKLGVPGHEELAFGAIAGDERVLEDETVAALGIEAAAIARVEAAERAEAERRMAAYRPGRPPHRVAGRIVILVDDGVATGSTARAALRCLRRLGPARLVFAAPVGPAPAAKALRAEADDVVIAHTPAHFGAVGTWYEDFGQTTDEEVLALLRVTPTPSPPGGERDVVLRAGASAITASVAVPAEPRRVAPAPEIKRSPPTSRDTSSAADAPGSTRTKENDGRGASQNAFDS